MKELSKKQKIVAFIAVLLIAVILAIVIITNIVSNNDVANEGYEATANAKSTLVASCIKKGITVGGITGTLESLDTSDATAKPEDIVKGKTAYVNGVKITGTYEEIDYISKTTSYVGSYVDIDDDESADGIIYADLCIGGSRQWKDSDGIYTIPKETNTKEYYIKEENYSNIFGTRPLIATDDSSSRKERFYVMALNDIDSSMHYWYYNAYGKIYDYSTITSVDFGAGKQNTQNMIDEWNNSSYGAQNSNDIWGLIQNEVNNGWFVPSRGELAAFIVELGISTQNYGDYMSSNTASSSLASSTSAWAAHWGYQSMASVHLNGINFSIRLSTTF